MTLEAKYAHDAALVARCYRMHLTAKAIHYSDRDRELALRFYEASECAGALAGEYSERALFLAAASEASA
jgi:hypothetical protein